jgi:hypothetical protein
MREARNARRRRRGQRSGEGRGGREGKGADGALGFFDNSSSVTSASAVAKAVEGGSVLEKEMSGPLRYPTCWDIVEINGRRSTYFSADSHVRGHLRPGSIGL